MERSRGGSTSSALDDYLLQCEILRPKTSSRLIRYATPIGHPQKSTGSRRVAVCDKMTGSVTLMNQRLSASVHTVLTPPLSAGGGPFEDMAVASANSKQIHCLVITAVGAHSFWCGWSSGHVSVYDSERGALIEALYAHRGAVTQMCTCGVTSVFTSSADSTTLQWNESTRQVMRTIQCGAGSGLVRSMCVLKDCSGLVLCLENGGVLSFPLDDEKNVCVGGSEPRHGHKSPVLACFPIVLRREGGGKLGNGLWTGCEGGAVRVHDLNSAPSNKTPTLALNHGRVTSLVELQGSHGTKPLTLAACGPGQVIGLHFSAYDALITVAFTSSLGAVPNGTSSVLLSPLGPSSAFAIFASGAVDLLVLNSTVSSESSSVTQVEEPVILPPLPGTPADSKFWSDRAEAIERRYERKLRDMAQAVSRAKEFCQEMNLRYSEHTERRVMTERSCDELSRQCEILTEALDKKTTESEGLRQQVADRAVELHRALESAASQEKMRTDGEIEVSSMRNKELRRQELVDKLHVEVATRGESIAKLRETIDQMRLQVAERDRELSDARARCLALDTIREQADQSVKDERRKFREIEVALHDAVGQLQKETAERRSYEERAHLAESKQLNASRLVENLSSDVAAVREQLRAKEAELHNTKAQLQRTLSQAQQEANRQDDESARIFASVAGENQFLKQNHDEIVRKLQNRVTELEIRLADEQHRASLLARSTSQVQAPAQPVVSRSSSASKLLDEARTMMARRGGPSESHHLSFAHPVHGVAVSLEPENESEEGGN